MSAVESILARKSIRSFLDKPVTREQVEKILDVARRAPSGGNTQPWHLYVVGGDVKNDITETIFQEFENGNVGEKPEYSLYPPAKASKEYMDRRRKLGYDMYKLLGIERDDQVGRFEAVKNNFTFFGAPVGIFVTVDRFSDRNAWGHVGMLIQNITLIAEQMGLSTCLQEAWNSFPSIIYKKLDIDSSKEVLWCGIALGYADTSAKVNELISEREPVSKIAKFYGFSKSAL